MTDRPSEPAAEGSGETEEPRDFVKYTFFHLLPEWRRLPTDVREEGKRRFAEVLAHPPEGVLVRTYALTGLKAGTEMMVWTIGAALEPIQELQGRLLGTPLGGYLETPYSYLGLARRSEYLGEHAHGGEGSETRRRPFDLPYLFVYPFVKKREWYALSFEERRRIMGEHFRVGHRYPKVRIHTGYSFGLDDMEFILAFEADAPADFLDLVSALRPSEASRYTALETPIFTCVLAPARRMLDLADGLP
ncbi:MAG TPA: chlorite dismutase family protein [Thermoplasmata archaeon]|nr:chlorite dismutase family protein [Thermoplasmata archaeon]